MVFDLKDKKNKLIIDYMKDRSGLVVAGTSMNRATFKKILSQLGMNNQKINLAATHLEAIKMAEEMKPNIIISDYKIANTDTIDLLKKHKLLIPNRLEAIFMVIAENNSPAMVCKVADEDAESLVIKPYNMETLEKELLRVLADRIEPTNYQKKVEAAHAKIVEKDYQSAMHLLEAAIIDASNTNVKSARAYYLKSVAQMEAADVLGAVTSLESSLMSDSKYYKSILGLIDIHMKQRKYHEAYEGIENLLKNYPPNPERIPDFIKVCIANEKFDSVIQICDIFVNLEEKIPTIEQPIAAGLALSAKYLIDKQQNKKAMVILEKAAELGRSNIKIMSSVLKSMIQIGETDKADRILGEMSGPDAPKELRLVELDIRAATYPPIDVLKYTGELFKQGIKDYVVYVAAIKSSIASGRKKSAIEDVVHEASNMYPDKKDELESMIAKLA